MIPPFDPATERARFEARQGFLARQAALRLDLAEGITFQPETRESVEDQVIESLWAEGLTPETAPAKDLAEAWASFATLSPCREEDTLSLVATLFLGFPAEVREARLAALQHFPDQLNLELSDGSTATPFVDRGTAGPEDRLPSVLALRYPIPDGLTISALVSSHPTVPGRWAAPGAWAAWHS